MQARVVFILLLAWNTVLTAGALSAAEPPNARIDFRRDIRPLLSDACFQCHGPDEGERRGEVRLDQPDDLYEKRDGRPLIVPYRSADSELFIRLSASRAAVRMPPPAARRQLTNTEIDRIRKWIDHGGTWESHWAYVRPQRRAIPIVRDPAGFVRNPIDAFVLERLNEREIAPSREADRVTLVRRLYFDLVGLPPTARDVADFISDERPDAYEHLVDRLLAAPQFGERLAIMWLDLVRYADTNGYLGDRHEDRDLYRDWVIGAFNRNLPFDRFTIEQLAGDLLPDADDGSRIASGYNRLLMTTREAGGQPMEYLARYAADRVRNLSSVWLAGTMACAACHDHKYDPFTMRDFYSLAAFFADIQEVPVGAQPQTRFATAQQTARLETLDRDIALVRRQLDRRTPALDAAQTEWERSLRHRSLRWTTIRPVGLKAFSGASLRLLDDGSILATDSAARDEYELTFHLSLKGITAIRLEAIPDDALPHHGPGLAEQGGAVLTEFSVTADGQPLHWSAVEASFAAPGFPASAASDGRDETGWGIFDRPGQPQCVLFELDESFRDERPVTLRVRLQQNFGDLHTLGRFQLAVTTAPHPSVQRGRALIPQSIANVLKIAPERRSAGEKSALAAYYRSISPLLEGTRRKLAELQLQRRETEAGVRKTLITTAGIPRTTRILARGNWMDESGEVVVPAIPAALSFDSRPSRGERLNRLDLARWLINPNNPLTARVFVNRLWKLLFGDGLVRTVDDFGSQGRPPTHPELLDWLALEFADPTIPDATVPAASSAWDIKRIVRLIVTSGAYRQSSAVDAAALERDPFNMDLARQGRFRLDAELVRDNALAVSGLLDRRLGGPSVKPYQPAGYWSLLNREWQCDTADGLYRRGLYTYWCRTFLHPSLKAFDAPTREECMAERPRSNTPLQALVLLNDPTYVEAARAFAERILREAPGDTGARIQFAFSEALSRAARPEEIDLMQELLERHRIQYHQERSSAHALLEVGRHPTPADVDASELAAWTSVARVLFNLHASVTRN